MTVICRLLALNSQVVYETDLAFRTTYEDGKCASREHTQAKSRDSIRIMNEQAIKNWRCRRPENETIGSTLL